MTNNQRKQSLKLENNEMYTFQGQLFAEASWFDDDTQDITRQRIYSTDEGAHVFSISEGDGEKRAYKVYELKTSNDNVHLSNLSEKIDMPQDLFMTYVKSLISCIDNDSSAETTLEQIEELLKAANA